jgi:hypothetical protein
MLQTARIIKCRCSIRRHDQRAGIELGSLIPSLIHPRAPASIGVHPMPLSRQADLCGQSCMMILNPEKRKVGGSTPPLTTSSGEHCDLWQAVWVTNWVTNTQFPGASPQSIQYGRKVPSAA